MDDDGAGGGPVELRCAVTVAGTEVHVDLTGSAPTQTGAINCPWPFTVTTCRFALKRVTTPTLPATAGDHRPLTVEADESSIFKPLPPAATFVGAGTSLRLSDMIVRAFAQAAPGRIPADNGGDLVVAFGYVVDESRRTSIFFDAGAIGHGAIAGGDGLSAAIHPTEAGAENLPVEMLEARMPVRKTSFQLIEDSGGAGEFRGGLAAAARFEFAAPGRLTIWAEKAVASRPAGLAGGLPPPTQNVSILFAGTEREQRLGKAADVAVDAGDVLEVRPAGGAGFGDPLLRAQALVAADVEAGYVSREAARELYGVVFLDESLSVDQHETERLRKERSR
jgi:N-methylhydantoinase B